MLTRPAVIGGLVIGVLSALPLFAAANLCCCLWVVTGGVVASYLLQQDRAEPIALSDGALVGLLAGLIGSGVYLVLSIPITMMVAPLQREVAEQMINSGTLPPEFRDYLTDAIGGSAGIAIGFFFMLISGIIFATLGGLLGAAMFRKPTTPVVTNVSGPM